MSNPLDMFRLDGRTAVVTAGAGILGSAIAKGLAGAGARVVICDIVMKNAEALVERINAEGGRASCYYMDAMKPESINKTCDEIIADIGVPNILVSAVGGNDKAATTSPEQSFFDIPLEAMQKVIALNLIGGALLPTQVFAKHMKDLEQASIITISSMNALRPLTRIPAYSAAKAALSNFTQWLAVHLAQEYNPRLRVNALAPGFFLTEQNRFLLTDKETSEMTPRGQTILAHTPMARYGDPDDLVGAALWLASDASRFVTGIVLPVDGGFSAFSGV